MATTISRQPRATSIRRSESIGPSYDGFVVQRMKERFGNAPEQIRDRENASRDRYNAFLEQQGIDPNMIGNATLTGNAANRGLSVPTFEQEWDAVALADQAAAQDSRLRIAANSARRRGRSDLWADIQNQLDVRQNFRGGNSSDFNRRYWADRLQGAYDYRTANGFSPY